MFEMETKQAILNRLIKYYQEIATENVNKIEGGFTQDTLAANAKEFEKTYAECSLIVDAAFVQTSWGEPLTKLAEQFGIIRKEATKAIATLTVTGSYGAIIPKGAIFATADGKNFLATETTPIGESGTVNIEAQAQESGASYNVQAEMIVKIPVSIYGVQSVINVEAAHDGYEEETDDALRERVLFKVRQPATSGNKNHYMLWASEVAGVGGVKVLPLWNGNGTVKVVITNTDNAIASDDLIKQVQEHIEEQAPIGATLTVTTPEPLAINISLKITKGIGNTDGIKQAVNNYFKKNVFNLTYVSLAQVGKTILEDSADTGVQDYDDLMLNDEEENIPLTVEQFPIVGEVLFNE